MELFTLEANSSANLNNLNMFLNSLKLPLWSNLESEFFTTQLLQKVKLTGIKKDHNVCFTPVGTE